MYLIGYDIGSSSIKAALVEASSGAMIAVAQHPEQEMAISSPKPDWAEQDPDDWWKAVCAATRKLIHQTGVNPSDILSIGIAYQMHGLVCVDQNGAVLRPAIIWCDSRAVSIGKEAFEHLGADFCLQRYLNAPGNFTASKLRWVKENQPHIFERIHKIMLPGDYIAYRMSGSMNTTVSGLSEGILWDFQEQQPAFDLLQQLEITRECLPDLVPVCGRQGELSRVAAVELGLSAGTLIGYRAGDQPNNAMALNVLQPGELAATGGTSGVVYAVSANPVFDSAQRVNSFAHVNYSSAQPNTGVLLCINGVGSMYRWLREMLSGDGNKIPYEQLESLAGSDLPGSGGLLVLPFGNGAERMLGNQNPGACILGLQVNRHGKAALIRGVLEGIAFSFVHGIQMMERMGITGKVIRVGNDNLFQSGIFSQTIADLSGLTIDVYQTTGAVGAAKASGVAAGIYPDLEKAMTHCLIPVQQFHPTWTTDVRLTLAFERWQEQLAHSLHSLSGLHPG
ncbi:MAG: carbohydrate kinase [Saprospiraceae bacterium]|nr:carbohydrate kinase [Saprospiraceae bacterium]